MHLFTKLIISVDCSGWSGYATEYNAVYTVGGSRVYAIDYSGLYASDHSWVYAIVYSWL